MTLRQRLAAQVTDIRTRGQRLIQLNLELLTAELKEKGRKFGTAIGLFVAAGLLSLYGLGFLLTTIAVLLALVLPLWAALLIVTVALFVLVAILVLLGRDRLRKIGDPKPQAAVAEAKATADMLKANARGTVTSVRQNMGPKPAPASPTPAVESLPATGSPLASKTPPEAGPPASSEPSEPSDPEKNA